MKNLLAFGLFVISISSLLFLVFLKDFISRVPDLYLFILCFSIITYASFAAIYIDNREIENIKFDKKEIKTQAISLVYMYNEKKITLSIETILIGITIVASLISYMYESEHYLKVAVIPIIAIILLHIRYNLIVKRVRSGIFGTNENEAKELLKFILAKTKNIDYTDGKGKKEGVKLTV